MWILEIQTHRIAENRFYLFRHRRLSLIDRNARTVWTFAPSLLAISREGTVHESNSCGAIDQLVVYLNFAKNGWAEPKLLLAKFNWATNWSYSPKWVKNSAFKKKSSSESPNSLMDAAVSMSQASLPTSGGSDMYFKVVYEDPERPNGLNNMPQCAASAIPNSSFSSSVDKLIDEQEKNLIKQLESTSMSLSQRFLSLFFLVTRKFF